MGVWRTKKWLIVLFLAPFLVIIVGGIFVYLQQLAKKDPSERPSSTEQVSEEQPPAYVMPEAIDPDTEPDGSTPGWKIYTNSDMGYSIEHPKDWFVYPIGETDTIIESFRSSPEMEVTKEIIKINIHVATATQGLKEGQSLLSWVQEDAKISPPGINNVIAEVSIGPEIRVRKEARYPEPEYEDEGVVVYYASKGKWVFILAANPPNSILLPKFEKIVETFRFIP